MASCFIPHVLFQKGYICTPVVPDARPGFLPLCLVYGSQKQVGYAIGTLDTLYEAIPAEEAPDQKS